MSEAAREIDKLMGLHPKGFDLSLDRITRLLDILGNPHKKLPPVIHVAGTNGKGSVTAFCRALLEAGGLSVHVHTSPHLVNWHERYRLGIKGGRGKLVDDAVFADVLRRIADANGGEKITVFEILTAATFMLFSEQPADVAIIEVGLGGRFDATNVISDPAASVIMPISLDHQPYLGDRVELIAAEKAGIMKPGRPVVIGHQEYDAALDVLISTAERLRCPTAVFGQDFSAHEEYGRLVYQDEFGLADLPLPRLPGRHQYANAAAAIRAVKAAGFVVTEAMMEKAMASVEWAGRLQRLTEGDLLVHAPEGAEIWVDGGHNPGAGEVIAEAMANFEERQPRPLFLITGMINTKDPVGYFKAFTGLAEKVYCVPIRGSDSMIDPVVLAGAAYDAGLVAEPMSSVGQALDAIKELAVPDLPAPRILIGGSLYLVGDVLADNGTPPK
ncbi:bifunctional folylpolyglutamate synthase/dihydrofolate synthase [Rhizobium sp. CB3171]|uniref:bifunctional folylpolyglutamate synthase/dihydrofolate synthase n=1 Tax=unclassified Rhizobium TaxID=2613769 RepID=UPI000CDF377F|nr:MULTISPECIES: folylpolyglutamate synthase/dihydrofolate synthase family protein [Rhizobium]AVA19717.1 bifunctional folylpolyglutamate synthase/dihydrofolate synthase [Rhizobium sp. NXC24]MDK4742796.1 bifunctional folylpolyglutamate synthase/dihydrofolate synthase [Rhizobium sp. CNPSo 3464]UWU23390.1 bifunctional folylpolyglutamate synthase/dihydrofolate synthase [Rhizobium tropici]WFU04169.1 bifunctional folylpolyglutamate synthase/dihydrofolate synthase [Rhizobium sp. CB3171]